MTPASPVPGEPPGADSEVLLTVVYDSGMEERVTATLDRLKVAGWTKLFGGHGFGGTGHQVRDCLHPKDLATLIAAQLRKPERRHQVLNVSGGVGSSISLARLSQWCADRFGPHTVGAQPAARRFDVPWLVLDAGRAERAWGWRPAIKMEAILEELARHAEQHPEWLELSEAV